VLHPSGRDIVVPNETENLKTFDTSKALAGINDEGKFEQLATALLRAAHPLVATLSHPGVNKGGRTRKSPFDAVGFVRGAHPPHLLAVHHTITSIGNLASKWLHDPATVVARRPGSTPTAPPGDLIKTAELVAAERVRTPELRATLILTTNEEPGVELVRDVNAEAAARGLDVEIWPRSQLAHVLDNDPTGQWIRRTFLGIEQERLSPELLSELAWKNFDAFRLRDDPRTRIAREDERVLSRSHRPITFLIAGSGLGKSVVCYRIAEAHVNSGAYSLFLSHEIVERVATLEQAVSEAIRSLYPSLALSETPLSFCSADKPLLVIIEDINLSGQPQRLVEKIARWADGGQPSAERSRPWRLICPMWPQIIAALDNQTLKHLQPMLVELTPFSEEQAQKAIVGRAALTGKVISDLSAARIANDLGNDPLLIGLYDFTLTPDPHQVLNQYVETVLRQSQTVSGELSADLRLALMSLAEQMILRRRLSPKWREVGEWDMKPDALKFLKILIRRNDLLGTVGTSSDLTLTFRHDRVRDWLLVESMREMDAQGRLPDQIVSDPFYAEILASTLVRVGVPSALTARLRELNPLALFYSLVLLNGHKGPARARTIGEIRGWLAQPESRTAGAAVLRGHALAVLENADGSDIPQLVGLFPEDTTSGQLARLRNGDLNAAIAICVHFEPGSNAVFRDRQIQHVRLRFGDGIPQNLDKLLRIPELTGIQRSGLLRFAGHLANASLAPAIATCWSNDSSRVERLADYLWAFGECCEESNAADYLGPVCDAWAALSDTPGENNSPSPRENLAEYDVRWAFERHPPVGAIEYFIQRAGQSDLNWPITYMLHGLDLPKAVVFVAHAMADMRRKFPNGIVPFLSLVTDHWKRRQRESDRPMSSESRKALLEVWQIPVGDLILRRAAFDMWASAESEDDVAVLCSANTADGLHDRILQQRLERGDLTAIPALVKELESRDDGWWWWYFARRVWSPELTHALDDALSRKSEAVELENIEWQYRQALMRMPAAEAEHLLLKHWEKLRFGKYFVQVALFLATPALRQLVATCVLEAPNAKRLFAHISLEYAGKTDNNPGITRQAQIEALEPYLDLLSSSDLSRLAYVCNEAGWFDLRRRLFDSRVRDTYTSWRPETAKLGFDELSSGTRPLWIDNEIDRALKTGTTWSEYRTALEEWLADRQSISALNLVAQALRYKGSRSDLSILKAYEGMPREHAESIIANARFSVYRNSIE
jgi:hypothetical protein